jgi:protein phosphatase
MRVLGDFEGSVDIDSAIFDTEPGDRWLLCSDGLCGFVPEPAIAQVLASEPDAAKAAEKLITLTLDRGAPDNVTIVIAGVNETNMSAAAKPLLVGAAALPLLFDAVTRPLPRVVSRLFSPKSGSAMEEHFETADYLDTLVAEDKRRAAQRRSRWAVYFSLALAVVVGFGIYGYVWTQSQFFVGTDGDSVVVYRGINGDFGSIPLHTIVRDTDIPLSSLSDFVRTSVELTIPVLSLTQALLVVERIEIVSQSP